MWHAPKRWSDNGPIYKKCQPPASFVLRYSPPGGGQRFYRRGHADKNSSITRSLSRAGSNLNSGIVVNNSPEPAVRCVMMQACTLPKGCGVRKPAPQDCTDSVKGGKKLQKKKAAQLQEAVEGDVPCRSGRMNQISI